MTPTAFAIRCRNTRFIQRKRCRERAEGATIDYGSNRPTTLLCAAGTATGTRSAWRPGSVTVNSGRSILLCVSLGLLISVVWCGTVSGAQLGSASGDAAPHYTDIRLSHGSIGSYLWAVYAHREGPSATPKRPCLTAASGAASEGAPSSGFTLCGRVTRDAQILVAKSDGVGRAERTVLGMAFPNHVRSVQLWLRGKRSRRLWLKQLSSRQAAAAGLIRFRYAAEAFSGPFCLRRFASYSVSGERLRVSPRMGCPS